MNKLLFSLLFLLTTGVARAQKKDLSGTWEGIMDGREFLQINLVKGKGKYCGYTWDYELNDKTSFCKAFFDATYDEESKAWVFIGRYFIDRSASHQLMVLRLSYTNEKNISHLRGTVAIQSQSIWGLREEDVGFVDVKRVAPTAQNIYKYMQDCIDERKRKTVTKKKDSVKITPPATVQKPPVKIVPKPPVQTPVKRNPPVPMPPPQKDTAKINAPSVPKIQTPEVNTTEVKKMEARKRTEVSRLKINTRDIVLKLYDNGVVDNDTVSVFYNGRLIAGKKWLSEKPITIPLHLDENTNIHEITMFAENLGSIPPNTALIIVTAGDKRYELRSSATLDTNAVLVFEYSP